ncbi:MAG: hypothetical protein ABFD08_14645 [Syntrophomonas sp.]
MNYITKSFKHREGIAEQFLPHRCNEAAPHYNPPPVLLMGTRQVKEAEDIFSPRYKDTKSSAIHQEFLPKESSLFKKQKGHGLYHG